MNPAPYLLFLVLAPVLYAQEVSYEQELAPVAFLVDEFEGTGNHPLGEYRETMSGEWALNKTVVLVRSRSRMGERVVFEDLRVLSYDATSKRIRMRQYAFGDVVVYDVAVADGGKTLVMEEAAREGRRRPAWRYTLSRAEGGFSYTLARNEGAGFAKYLTGRLSRKLPALNQQGKNPYASLAVSIPRAEGAPLVGELHFPEGDGPFPVIVMSPGGNANTHQGYSSYGKWFASWGFVTALVAFNDDSAESRAKKFSEVLDWLTAKNAEEGFKLRGKLDTKRFVACGHSRGGHASVLAARRDKRFIACVALAPAGPEGEYDGDNHAATFVIVGDRDRVRPAARNIFERSHAPRYLLTVRGMDHMFRPRTALLQVIGRATAFLKCHVAGDRRYQALLTEPAAGVQVEADTEAGK